MSNLHSRPNTKVKILKTCESTQVEMKNWIQSDPALDHGSVIVALKQTSGKGRNNRAWISHDQNLMVTFFVRDYTVPPTWIPLLVGHRLVRLVEGLKKSGDQRKFLLKWPNDLVLLDQQENEKKIRKVAGILCETSTALNGVLVGIGMNCQYDPKLSDRPTAALEIDRDVVLEALIKSMQPAFSNQEKDDFVSHYSEFAAFPPGSQVLWFEDDRTLIPSTTPPLKEAEVLGIGDFGQLNVRFSSGEIAQLFSGEVRLSYSR